MVNLAQTYMNQDRLKIAKKALELRGFAGGAIRRVKTRLDYAEYGGAPLLGVKGGVVICHGSSDARAMKNAIRSAASLHRDRVEDEIARVVT